MMNWTDGFGTGGTLKESRAHRWVALARTVAQSEIIGRDLEVSLKVLSKIRD